MNIRFYIYILFFYCIFLGDLCFSALGEENKQNQIDQASVVCERFISRVSEEYYSLDGSIKICCTKTGVSESGSLEMSYNIICEQEVIGDIFLDYYEKGGCYQTRENQLLDEPTIHLAWIGLSEKKRRNGYGKKALEALFQGLKKSDFLPDQTLLGLEYELTKPFLSHFYERFGFVECPRWYCSAHSTPSNFRVMLTRLGKLKFF